VLKHRPRLTPPPAEYQDPEILPCRFCQRCVRVCPSGALRYQDGVWSLDLRLCLFCQDCAAVCPNQLIAGIPA
jgi:ferredoxin